MSNLSNLPACLREITSDTNVRFGKPAASRILCRSLLVLGYEVKVEDDLKPKTAALLHKAVSDFGCLEMMYAILEQRKAQFRRDGYEGDDLKKAVVRDQKFLDALSEGMGE